MELFTLQPDAPVLSLGGFMANDDPIQIFDIQGLGPVKAEILSTPFATGRGELFQGSSTGKRNIVLNMGFNPNWAGNQTVSSLRQLLYRYLLPEHWTKLRFYSDELPMVDIEGYVESIEPNMFSQDPEALVSIICPRPDFIEADATIITGVVDDGTLETEFEYVGTVNTGFELRVDGSPENPAYTGQLELNLNAYREDQRLTVNPITVDGTRYLKVSTLRNAKRVQSVAKVDGALTNLLAVMSGGSVWPEVKPGGNIISVAAAEFGQTWTLAYFNRFGGL